LVHDLLACGGHRPEVFGPRLDFSGQLDPLREHFELFAIGWSQPAFEVLRQFCHVRRPPFWHHVDADVIGGEFAFVILDDVKQDQPDALVFARLSNGIDLVRLEVGTRTADPTMCNDFVDGFDVCAAAILDLERCDFDGSLESPGPNGG
jgi:hypothetical protein